MLTVPLVLGRLYTGWCLSNTNKSNSKNYMSTQHFKTVMGWKNIYSHQSYIKSKVVESSSSFNLFNRIEQTK